MIEHIRRILREDLKRALHPAFAAEVGRQDFDLGIRAAAANGSDAIDEMLGAAVAQIVAIDAGHDHILQAHVGDGAREILRLLGVRRFGPAVGDIAERAAAGADLAENHEGRGAVAEAFVDIRAASFFAHGDEPVFAQLGLEVGNGITARDAHTNPRRLAQHWSVGELHRRSGDFIPRHLFDARLQ